MIIVFGSINMDMLLTVPAFPAAGETAFGTEYRFIHGGKGANQALAASRMGLKTALVACVGDDGFGMRIVNGLRRDGVLVTGVGQSPRPTGLAVIMVRADGENQIVITPGANADLRADQVPDEILGSPSVLLLQGETPPAENWILLKRARACGAITILNLAPVIDLPKDSLADLDYLIVNQIEARQIAAKLGLDFDHDTAKLAHTLSRQNLTCVITMGGEGAIAVTPDGMLTKVAALALNHVVDTTGAGDAWCGTFAAALHQRKTLAEAMKLASVAGSLACLTLGAQEAFPYQGQIEEHLPLLPDAVHQRL